MYQVMTGHMDAYHSLSFPDPHFTLCPVSLPIGSRLVTGLQLESRNADYGVCVHPHALLYSQLRVGMPLQTTLLLHAEYGVVL